ncbi:MAG TPA: ABC-F family ATP-binding cassette domain-containing protein [Ktedonobacterales bacterium]
MLLINAHGVTKSFGGVLILDGLDLQIEDHARMGLIGQNGTGKSTLLRILAGQDPDHGGDVARKRGLRVAFLPQHLPGDDRLPVAAVCAARPEVAEHERQLAACEAELALPEVIADMRRMERVLARQEALLRQMEQLGLSGVEGEARSLLMGLGLDERDLLTQTRHLSGGQRKIIGMAACLIQRPDLLLLDEPETHLDLPHRQQLERFVGDFDGAVVMVSHDRYLLDETVSEIAELDGGKITLWVGNYSAYATAREVALMRQQELFVAQQKEIARLEEAIARFKLWASIVVNERHIKQARNKQRQIDRMAKVERPVLERHKMGLRLRSAQRGGQKVLELRDASMAFDGTPIILAANLLVMRGERVGIIGPNGTGKSVLGKLLAGQLDPVEGSRWVGPSIRVGYFSQGNDSLPADRSPLELVRDLKEGPEEQAIALLGRFLFKYEQVRQPVRALSGGERSRLQLALLMLGGANCLVLDEPTNHLDIDSVEALEAALDTFDGTALVISHDRYFLDRVVDRVIEVREGEARSYEGGYSAWQEAHAE